MYQNPDSVKIANNQNPESSEKSRKVNISNFLKFWIGQNFEKMNPKRQIVEWIKISNSKVLS